MHLIQPVRIAHVLTEKSKHDLRKSFTQEKLRLEQECEQLLFEQKKLQRQMKDQKVAVEQKFQKEIQARINQQHRLDFKLEQLSTLPLGRELVEKEVDALVEVSIGSKWSTIQNQITIVIEDDVIIRIDR